MYEILINTNKCNGCGECVDICPSDVYEIQDGKCIAINAEECVGCESCMEVCERNAITVKEFGTAAA